MGSTYFICVGTFQAALQGDRLVDLPRAQFRKLLRLALTEPKNRLTLDAMGADIRRHVADADLARKKAERDFRSNWQRVAHPHSRRLEVVKIMEENRRLKEAVRKTKGHYSNWISIQTIFEKGCS